jgi:ferric-dicitrate binding protein FerR (iron transport regulator)
MHLDPETAVAVRHDRVDIEHGRVVFEVTAQAQSFRVSVGLIEIGTTGAKFEVDGLPDSVLVTVVEGQVKVAGVSDLSSAGARETLVTPPIVVSARQRLRVSNGAAVVEPVWDQ